MFKKIRNSILMSLCVIFLFSNISFAAIYPDTFRVQGNQIVNSLNQPVKFYGVGFFEDRRVMPNKHWDDTWLENAFNTARQWGSNVIRICLIPMYSRHIGIDNYILEIEKYVNYAKKHNMYIILNWHSEIWPFTSYMHNDWYPEVMYTTTAEMEEVWEKIAKHFIGEKTILAFELLNEPLWSENNNDDWAKDWNTWKTFAEEKLINKIRQHDPDRIIIFNGPHSASELRFALTNPINTTNIMYGLHPFPWTGTRGPNNTGLANYNAWITPTVRQKPVIVTEFTYWNEELYPADPTQYGIYEKDWNGPGRFREDIMNYIKENNLSWITAQFVPDNHSEYKTRGVNVWSLVDENWNPNLDFGYFFRDHLFEEAEKGKVHVNVPNATFTWTINGGNRNTYVNGDIVEIVPNAKYVVTTSLGHRIEVEINSVNDTFNITQLAMPSSGGGGGCNTTNTDTSHAITILMFVCLLYVITKKQNVK